MNDEDTIAGQLQRALKRLVISTMVLFLGLVALFFYGYNNAANRDALEKVAITTNTALCAMRSDFEAQVASSEKFLKDNPDGLPGIPASLIQAGIERDKHTVVALSGLDCG